MNNSEVTYSEISNQRKMLYIGSLMKYSAGYLTPGIQTLEEGKLLVQKIKSLFNS